MLDDATKKKIYDHYIKGQGSIQDIARVYRCTVEEVLQIIAADAVNKADYTSLTEVETTGDMIDQAEAGTTPVNMLGQKHRVNFDIT
jgi:hypothetical protein